MPKSIQSFNADDEVSKIIKEVKQKKEQKISEFINKCILEAQKPKQKPRVVIKV